jgi:hypothetical protein
MKRLAVLAMFAAATASLTAQAPALNIPFETYSLPNGLTVVLSIDRTTPTTIVSPRGPAA